MRPLVAHGRDDRGMVIAPAGDADSGGLAGRRVAPLGADQQRRATSTPPSSSATVTRCSPRSISAARDIQQQVDIRRRPRRARSAAAAGGSRASCRAARRRPPAARTRGRPAASPSVTRIVRIGQPGSGKPVADADRVEHPPRGGGDGGGAAVEARRPRQLSGSAGSTTMLLRPWIERDGQRQADQAAAEDDDVRAFHALPPASGESQRVGDAGIAA